MDIKNIITKLRQINEALSLQSVQAAEKQAMDAAAAKKKAGGMGGFLTLDPRTAGNDALAALAAQNGLPGLMNSSGEFVVAQGDADFHSKPNSPRTAPPNRDDTMALQKLGLIPSNAQGPSGLANFLSGGGADKEFQASKTDSLKTNATNTSNEFIKKRLGQLKNLVARIRSTGAAAGSAPAQSGKSVMKPAPEKGWDAPGVKESIRSSLSNILKEEFGYDLSEKVTLGTGPVVQQDVGNGMTISVGKFQKEVSLIRKIMAELADIDDPAVIAALQDAQAALDELAKGGAPAPAPAPAPASGSGDKEKDRARMKELVAITKKPPVASDSDLEETRRPQSLSESMGAIRNKLLLLEAPLPVPAGAGRSLAVRPNLPAKRPGAADDVIDVDARVIPDKKGFTLGQKVAGVGIPATAATVAGVNALKDPKQGGAPDQSGKTADAGAGRGGQGGPTAAELAAYNATKGATRSAGTSAEKSLPAMPASAGPAQSGKSESEYTIVKGDNLTKIAKKFGVSIQDIMKANPYIKDPNLIYAGKTLKIPGAGGATGGNTGTSTGGATGGDTGTSTGGNTGTSTGGATKTNLTKFYADEMKELETLIGKYASDPEMADDVKAAQTQLDALKATAK